MVRLLCSKAECLGWFVVLLVLAFVKLSSHAVIYAAERNQTFASPFLADNLDMFKSTLEAFAANKSDIVFILDESGSIGIDRFPHAVKFAELVTRLFSVAADKTRVALITFSTRTTLHFNYIKDHEGNNMCTLMKDLDIIGFSGGWTRTKDALVGAEIVLEDSRFVASK